jgi:hypothetical protein
MSFEMELEIHGIGTVNGKVMRELSGLMVLQLFRKDQSMNPSMSIF